MPRDPKPWFWKHRGQWVVNISGTRHYLGLDRKAAFEEFYRLMRQPVERQRVSTESVVAIIDYGGPAILFKQNGSGSRPTDPLRYVVKKLWT